MKDKPYTLDDLHRDLWRQNWYRPDWWWAYCYYGFTIWLKYTVLKDV
jgi:hypothetical protein